MAAVVVSCRFRLAGAEVKKAPEFCGLDTWWFFPQDVMQEGLEASVEIDRLSPQSLGQKALGGAWSCPPNRGQGPPCFPIKRDSRAEVGKYVNYTEFLTVLAAFGRASLALLTMLSSPLFHDSFLQHFTGCAPIHGPAAPPVVRMCKEILWSTCGRKYVVEHSTKNMHGLCTGCLNAGAHGPSPIS